MAVDGLVGVCQDWENWQAKVCRRMAVDTEMSSDLVRNAEEIQRAGRKHVLEGPRQG